MRGKSHNVEGLANMRVFSVQRLTCKDKRCSSPHETEKWSHNVTSRCFLQKLPVNSFHRVYAGAAHGQGTRKMGCELGDCNAQVKDLPDQLLSWSLLRGPGAILLLLRRQVNTSCLSHRLVVSSLAVTITEGLTAEAQPNSLAVTQLQRPN